MNRSSLRRSTCDVCARPRVPEGHCRRGGGDRGDGSGSFSGGMESGEAAGAAMVAAVAG